MTLFSKKIIKKVAAGMAIVSMLTPTVFAQTAPPIPLPPVVVTAQRIYDGAAHAAWNAMQNQMMLDQMAADAAFLAQQQQTDNNPIPQSNWDGVIMASNGEDVNYDVTAARVAAQNGIARTRWFSFCQPGSCVRWYVNSPTSVTECSSTGGLCK